MHGPPAPQLASDYDYSSDASADAGTVGWLLILTFLFVVSFSLCWAPPPATAVLVDRRSKPQRRLVRWGAPAAGAVAASYVSEGELIVLHLAAIVAHGCSAIAGALVTLTGDPRVSIVTPLFEYTSAGETYATPRPRVALSVHILMPLVAAEAIAAGFHCIYLLALMEPGVQARIRRVVDTPSANPLRWVEYAITATLMSASGAAALGITDTYFFVRLVASSVCLQAVGYAVELLDFLLPSPELQQLLERRAYEPGVPDALADAATEALKATQKRRHSLFVVLYYIIGQLLTNLPHLGVVLYQVAASQTHGAYSVFVENAVPFAVWYITFGCLSHLSYQKWRQCSDPQFVERWYILLSLSTKLTVFWLAFGTFRKLAEANGHASRVGVDWDAVRYAAIAAPAAGLLCYALYDAHAWRERGGGR